MSRRWPCNVTSRAPAGCLLHQGPAGDDWQKERGWRISPSLPFHFHTTSMVATVPIRMTTAFPPQFQHSLVPRFPPSAPRPDPTPHTPPALGVVIASCFRTWRGVPHCPSCIPIGRCPAPLWIILSLKPSHVNDLEWILFPAGTPSDIPIEQEADYMSGSFEEEHGFQFSCTITGLLLLGIIFHAPSLSHKQALLLMLNPLPGAIW